MCVMADEIDIRILQKLAQDGRATNHEIGEYAGLSPSAACRRVQALEQKGVIRGYAAIIDERALGVGTTAFVRVTLERQSGRSLEAFEKAVANCPHVLACYLMAGDFDYLLRVCVHDISEYEVFHKKYLSQFPGVARIETTFAVREVVAARPENYLLAQ
jgi:DNA-binding Lrp family transcriptional regulator